ncbi:MAG: GatB/YqeY domain-containing protein [Arenicellaceae bacterium]|nr:GatB/YqeY domain-containing protein [Arenicellaceae bacterium]
MSLKKQLFDDMKTAMRSKDKLRLETIRMIRAAIQRKEVDDRIELDETAVLVVLQKMVKQARDSIQQFTGGDRMDLVEKEQIGLKVLQDYLPEPLSDEELYAIISDAITKTGATEMRDMGKVMGMVKAVADGRADMGAVSGKIKALLVS